MKPRLTPADFDDVRQSLTNSILVLDLFFGPELPSVMPDEPRLTPADLDDVQQSLAFALRFQGRKRVHTADETMARITAERLVEHLKQSGFVIMKRPPGPWPTDNGHRPARG